MEEWRWDGVSHRQRGEKAEGALKSTPGPTLARCCCRELPAAPHIPNPAPAGTQAALSLLSEERGSPNEPPKSLPLTFSHFQEKKKNPSRMLEGKTSITCCGELSSQEEPWCRLGSRSLWVALPRRSSTDKLLSSSCCYGDGKCSSVETAARKRPREKDVWRHPFPRHSVRCVKREWEVLFLRVP